MSGSRDILVKGVVFSDLGRAGAFLGIDWVRDAIRERLGFDPYPGTLNVRARGADLDPVGAGTAGRREDRPSVARSGLLQRLPVHGLCRRMAIRAGPRERVAVVVPEVEDYPGDKLEVIAAVSLKETRSVRDGDELTVVFEA